MPDAADGGAWADEFAGKYRHASLENRKRRERRRRLRAAARGRGRPPGSGAAARARLAARFAEAGRAPGFEARFWRFVRLHARAGDPDARLVWRAECAPLRAEEHRRRRAGLLAEVGRRLREGFGWPGGPVGGDPAYHRGPFLHPGLVSDEHPVLELFVASTPRAALLRAGDTKAGAAHCGPKLLALDAPYVEADGAMRRVLRVELDRAFPGGFEGLAAALASRGAPPPNIAVGHLDGAGRLLHPHLIWLVDSPVAFVGRGGGDPRSCGGPSCAA